jgi:hypothetical protein
MLAIGGGKLRELSICENRGNYTAVEHGSAIRDIDVKGWVNINAP